MNIIKQYRKSNKLTQTELGELLGVSQSQVAHFENGRRGISPLIAIKLEKITNGEIDKCELRPDIFAAA